MQNDEGVFGDIADIFVQIFQQDLIETAFAVAETDIVFLHHFFVGDTGANAFATVVVVFP